MPGSALSIEVGLWNFRRNTGNEDFKLSYTAVGSYYSSLPPSADNARISFSVDARGSKSLGEERHNGDEFKYRVEVTNLNSTAALGMAVVVFRVPSCLEINYQLLDALLGNGAFDMYEVRNQNTEVVLYWRYIPAGETLRVDLGFIQAFHGKCNVLPDQAYLYYENDQVIWIEPR